MISNLSNSTAWFIQLGLIAYGKKRSSEVSQVNLSAIIVANSERFALIKKSPIKHLNCESTSPR